MVVSKAKEFSQSSELFGVPVSSAVYCRRQQLHLSVDVLALGSIGTEGKGEERRRRVTYFRIDYEVSKTKQKKVGNVEKGIG